MKTTFQILLITMLLASLSSCSVNKVLTTQEEFHETYISKANGECTINKEIIVLAVKTRQGDSIIFNKSHPGRIIDTGVYGRPQAYLLFKQADSSAVIYQKTYKGTYDGVLYVWWQGIQYEIVAQDSLGYICYRNNSINIPLNDIEAIVIRDKKTKTKNLIYGTSVLTVGLISAILLFALNPMDFY